MRLVWLTVIVCISLTSSRVPLAGCGHPDTSPVLDFGRPFRTSDPDPTLCSPGTTEPHLKSTHLAAENEVDGTRLLRNNEIVLVEERIEISEVKRIVLDIWHDFDLFIVFHESHEDLKELSLLLTTTGEEGDNTFNLPPVRLDYSVVSLAPESVIDVKLSQRVPPSKLEEIWNQAPPPPEFALCLLLVVFTCLLCARGLLRQRSSKAEEKPSSLFGLRTRNKLELRSSFSEIPGTPSDKKVLNCGELEDLDLIPGTPLDKKVLNCGELEDLDLVQNEIIPQRTRPTHSSDSLKTMPCLESDDSEEIMLQNLSHDADSTDKSQNSVRKPSPDNVSGQAAPHTKCRSRFSPRVISTLFFAALLVFALAVAVSRLHTKPTLHVTFPATNTFRKVRMFSDFPELTQLSKDHSSLSLVSRLQLLDAHRCKEDFKTCQINIVCDTSTDQSLNCRCRTGYYFKDWQCHACTSTCPADHYLVSSCNSQSDARCNRCSGCSATQYEAAPCTTQRDTICIDVSFPVGILPMNKSHLSDDGVHISVRHSSNVFMERLINMEALETPMYITNNQQSLDFVWPRLSGLDIAVSISGVFLVPDYHDVSVSEDDTALFQKLNEPSQRMKRNYHDVQSSYCRHPVPDYYSLQLEIIANRTSAAQLVRCDSKDESVPRCPQNYKDGDRYLRWNVNAPCTRMNAQKLEQLKGGPNSILCTEETQILEKVFQGSRLGTQEYTFPSRECSSNRQECEKCLSKAVCPAEPANDTEDGFLQDNLCCGIKCYLQNHCKSYYSLACPDPPVECAQGDVDIFSLFPHFDTMERQFACHLKYQPPPNLYSLSYTIRAPSINFNTTAQHFTVSATSREDHEKRLSSFDFINAFHDTRFKLQEELILIGDHSELWHSRDSLMKHYTVRAIKSPNELSKNRVFSRSYLPKQAFIQFEKPFMYSSLSWHRDGCNKNISRIYPNQTIYTDDYTPITARKNTVEGPGSLRNLGYSYQMYHMDREPYIKFYIDKGESVLQYLQGTIVKGKLNSNSLYGRVSWHHELATWKLTFSGLQENCPTVISLKIFTQLMTGCAGHFDILINCPAEFSVEFNFTTNKSDLPDIFVVQVNDSATTHNLVLSSVYAPVLVDEVVSENGTSAGGLKSADPLVENYKMWLPLFIIVIISLLLLVAVCVVYTCINKKAATFNSSPNSSATEGETQTLNNHGEKSPNSVLMSQVKPGQGCVVRLFIVMYIIYCVVFSFSLMFGLVYYIHYSTWSNFSSPDYLGKQLLTQVNKSLVEIQSYENKERLRLFNAYQDRRKACIHHLESENRRLLQDYESATKRQVAAMFMENGTVYSLSNYILKQNVSVYMSQINEFITNCNKTIHSIVDRFQANYFLFLRNVALNDWLQVPRQIFLYQDEEDINRKYLSSTEVKQFATWLGIDKAEELLAVGENVFGRLSSISRPQISVLNVTFPVINPQLLDIDPKFDYDFHSYVHTVLDPTPAVEQQGHNSTKSRMREKREADEFNLSGNLKVNPDNQDLTSNGGTKPNIAVLSRRKAQMKDYDKFYSDKTTRSVTPAYTARKKSEKYSWEKVEGIQTDDEEVVAFIKDQAFEDEKIDPTKSQSESEADSEDSDYLYALIGIFLTLDIVLILYRLSWLSDQVYATKHGYVDRIPTDDASKHVLEIQTAYHLPAFENPLDESSGYYVDTKEQLYPDKEPEMTILQDLPKSKDNDILQKIWNKKKNQSDDVDVRMARCFLIRWYHDLEKFIQRSFMSPLAWQGSVTFLAVTFLCIFIYCMSFWLTEDHFRSLVGGQFAAADVRWHLEMSSRHLHSLAAHLTGELEQVKEMCDLEIATLTDMFFSTVNMQSNMLTKTLQKLCQESKQMNCDELTLAHFPGGRIVGCNFLPLQAQTFHDLSLSRMEAFIAEEVKPIVHLSQWTLTMVTSLVATLLCGRLLCHATVSTVRHFMLLSNRLPRVRVYQSEDSHAQGGGAAMHRSQSWVESCESGVYLGETDEANKEER